MCAAGEVGAALGARCAAWPSRFPSAPVPARDWLLVFLADNEAEARAAAAEAAAVGFERGMTLEGGLRAYGHAARAQARPGRARSFRLWAVTQCDPIHAFKYARGYCVHAAALGLSADQTNADLSSVCCFM